MWREKYVLFLGKTAIVTRIKFEVSILANNSKHWPGMHFMPLLISAHVTSFKLPINPVRCVTSPFYRHLRYRKATCPGTLWKGGSEWQSGSWLQNLIIFILLMLRSCLVLEGCQIRVRPEERKPFQVSEGSQSHSARPSSGTAKSLASHKPEPLFSHPIYFTVQLQLILSMTHGFPTRQFIST